MSENGSAAKFASLKVTADAAKNLDLLRAKGFGPPPAPEDVPPLVGGPASIPTRTDAGLQEIAGDTDKARLHEAAAGELPVANDSKPKRRHKRVRGVEVGERRERIPEGYKQLNGAVPADVHLKCKIASNVHGKTVGEILTEALDLWHKKHDPKR